jgi:hypothetical protein
MLYFRAMNAMKILSLMMGTGAIALGGCHLPPRAADPHASPLGVNRELVRAPIVHIELLRVNDAQIPQDIWDRVMDRVRQHITGEIVVTDHGRRELPADDQGDLIERFEWPFGEQFGEAGAVTVESMRQDDRYWLPIDSHLLYGMALVTERDEHGEFIHEWIEPSVPPNVIFLAILPGDPGWNHTGYHRRMWTLEHGEEFAWTMGGSVVTIQTNVIHRRAHFNWARRRLVEWTLFHELGHALGVPADPSHVTMLLGVHCTYPHCAMYSPVDLRWFISLFLNGWPMELCQTCTEEIQLVREVEGDAREREVARYQSPVRGGRGMDVMCCSP